MKKYMKSITALASICAVIALLLALTNCVTAPIIKEQEEAATNGALAVVLPGGKGFTALTLTDYELPETIIEAYSEENGGYVFKMTTAGYASGLVVMCGINSDGVVTGATCVSSNETLSYEKTYGDNLKDKTLDTIDAVDTIAGATKTTAAYKNAVKDALNAFVIVNGGSVDLRDEAEILNDNLSAALPEAEGKFTYVFKTDKLECDAVYKADNGAGYVFVYGETFVGTDASGASDNAFAASDAQKVIAAVETEIDISKYELPSQVEKAYKVSNGNFVFEMRAAGYGINGDKWTASGEYIKIKVAVSKDGEVLDCLTVSQSESKGIGDACANPEFYNQFVGKTETNYNEIDAISGATITTNGYTTAILRAFEAVKILKGVA